MRAACSWQCFFSSPYIERQLCIATPRCTFESCFALCICWPILDGADAEALSCADWEADVSAAYT